MSVGCLEVFRGVNKVFRGVLIGCLPDDGKEDVQVRLELGGGGGVYEFSEAQADT